MKIVIISLITIGSAFMVSLLYRIGGSVTLAVMMGGLAGCAPSSTPGGPASPVATSAAAPSPTAPLPKVVATTTILCDLAKRIAAETIDLTCLLKPGVDGHVYKATPEDRRAIEDAGLILYSGYNFEPGLIKLIHSTSNAAPKVAVAEKAVPKPLLGEEHDHGHEGEEAHAHAGEKGADHAGETAAGEVPDPHVWQSAENGIQMAKVIQQELAKLVPEKASVYSQNAQALETELAQIHRWIQSQIATIPASARKLVTTHDALNYYSAAYNIPADGALQGISTEEETTAGRIKELVDEVKASQVPTIFAEVVVNPKLISAVARDARVKLSDRQLFSDSLGESGSGAETYPQMLMANTQTIVEGLGGKFIPFRK